MSDDVSINPETGNPNFRTTPEHKVTKVYAHNGMVVVCAKVGDQDVESIIERREAIHRAQAISDMAKRAKYQSDHDEQMDIVEMFIEAIKKAKEQADGQGYKSARVAMTGFKGGTDG